MTTVVISGVETSEGNATMQSETTTVASAAPTQDADNDAPTTTMKTFTSGNETTTIPPTELFNNATEKPVFPSLEGVDYRQSEYRRTAIDR